MNSKKISLYLFFSLLFLAASFGQPVDERTYLSENATVIEGENPNFNFGKTFYEHQLYFFGFVHGSATPQKIDGQLLMDLHKNGVRYYAPEADQSLAYFYNLYLKTGDSEILKFACEFQGYRTPQDASIQLYEKWQKIYAYTKNQPKKDQLTVLGWDAEISADLSLTHLAFLAPKHQTGVTLVDSLAHFRYLENKTVSIISGKPVWKSGKSWNYFFGTEKSRYYEKFITAYSTDSTAILTAFGAHADEVRLLMLKPTEKEREKIIYEHFSKKGLPLLEGGEKIYAAYGYFHIHQDEVGGSMSLAGFIAKNTDVKLVSLVAQMAKSACYVGPKMKGIGPVYIKGVKFKGATYKGYKTSNRYEGDHFFERIDGLKNLQKVAGKNNVVLFNLTGKNSPYKTKMAFANMKKGAKNWQIPLDKAATDYFQYIFLIQRSAANVPIEELELTPP